MNYVILQIFVFIKSAHSKPLYGGQKKSYYSCLNYR